MLLVFIQVFESIDILEYLWRNSKVEFLIDLMSRTLLISQWKFGDREETMYLVPSLFLKENEKLEKDTTTFDGRTCRFDFSEFFLPIGVFQRLMCLCVSHRYSYTK